VAPLELDADLVPRLVDGVAQADQSVVGEDEKSAMTAMTIRMIQTLLGIVARLRVLGLGSVAGGR